MSIALSVQSHPDNPYNKSLITKALMNSHSQICIHHNCPPCSESIHGIWFCIAYVTTIGIGSSLEGQINMFFSF